MFVGKSFPRPQIVLSDRAQIFFICSLQIWNNESMKDFLSRAYRVVNGKADDTDLEKTNIHTCLAHVLFVSVFIYLRTYLFLFFIGYSKNG